MRLTAVLLVSALIAGPASAQQPDFSKVEIRTEVLAPGVAVLFGQGGNIGVSHGPDGTVLIDDQFAPLTSKITAAVAGLGATPVRYVINTHWHGDHSGGNENLGKAGATIFAHEQVRVRLLAGNATTPPAAPAALPVVTFTNGITFHLNGDRIDAIFTGGGHTDGDAVLYWRGANVLHTGDLMMSNSPFPFVDTASGGNALHLVTTLDLLLLMINDQTKVIPGHGPVSTKAGLRVWRDRIAEGVEAVGKARADKRTLQDFLAANPLKVHDRPGAFGTADRFATAVWASFDAMEDHGHKPH
jgi:glyoxylase-like metal-dependent hydrolase (beta-lactamase superfamily II)